MKKLVVGMVVATGVLGPLVGPALCARSGQGGGNGDFAIYVAPGTIVKSAPCVWVTIHTNVSLGVVDGVSAAVDGGEVDVAVVYADARGNAVAKLRFDDVASRVAPPSATITLALVVDGEVLVASETVAVRD